MDINIDKDDIFERKADERGRISLPATKFKNKTLEIAILEAKSDEEEESAMKRNVAEMLRADGEVTQENVVRFKKWFELYEVEEGDIETLDLAMEDAGVPCETRVGIVESLKTDKDESWRAR